jgi:peptide/nickel transport system substrate-binding protein
MNSWNDEVPALEYDVEKAKSLLAEAGYPNGFETKIYATAQYAVQAAAVQDSLKEVGITTTVESVDNVNDLVRSGTPGIYFRLIAVGSADSASLFTNTFYPGYNYDAIFDFSDEYVELGKKINTSTDVAQKNALTSQAQKMLVWDDCLLVPMYYYTEHIYVGHQVHGYQRAVQYSSAIDARQLWVD